MGQCASCLGLSFASKTDVFDPLLNTAQEEICHQQGDQQSLQGDAYEMSAAKAEREPQETTIEPEAGKAGEDESGKLDQQSNERETPERAQREKEEAERAEREACFALEREQEEREAKLQAEQEMRRIEESAALQAQKEEAEKRAMNEERCRQAEREALKKAQAEVEKKEQEKRVREEEEHNQRETEAQRDRVERERAELDTICSEKGHESREEFCKEDVDGDQGMNGGDQNCRASTEERTTESKEGEDVEQVCQQTRQEKQPATNPSAEALPELAAGAEVDDEGADEGCKAEIVQTTSASGGESKKKKNKKKKA